MNALMYACSHGHSEVALLLIQSGSPLDVVDEEYDVYYFQF